jgi:hypothetical protein
MMGQKPLIIGIIIGNCKLKMATFT